MTSPPRRGRLMWVRLPHSEHDFKNPLKLTDMINLIKDESHRNEKKVVREVKLSDHVKEEKGTMRVIDDMSFFRALSGF